MIKRLLPVVAAALLFASCGTNNTPAEEEKATYEGQKAYPEMENYQLAEGFDLQNRLGAYAPFKLTADISHLSENDRKAVQILFQVADIMEDLYWKQTFGHKDFLQQIEDEKVREFAAINYGGWDRLNIEEAYMPFITGFGTKPLGANYYPLDMTKEEFEALEDENKSNLYTVVRRDTAGQLVVKWYHEEWAEELQQAHDLMLEAAELVENAGFKNYLQKRAKALITDEYYESDIAWMEMQDNNIDFVVGAIENYDDRLFSAKAAFESFILLKDVEWSKKLTRYSAMLPQLQSMIPIEDAYKAEVPGTKSDINAYEVVYYAGDCNAGSKTLAINLPNDERIHTTFGTRKLQLKNSLEAKFEKILKPISEVVIDPAQRKHITFNAFFTNTMFHEVGHAMGIKSVLNQENVTVREALKEVSTSIEEGKADIMGLWLVTKLYEMGEMTEGEVMDNYVTFFAGIFRSSRFGTASSHGKANMMRFRYFEEKGATTRNEDGTYTINFEAMKAATIELMVKILKIQGDGNYDAAKTWVDEKGTISETLKADIERINAANIPVDIVFDQGAQNLTF